MAYKNTQSGNVFFIILIGIAMFAALAMVISRGMRGQGTTAMSARDAELAAVDIMSYAQRVERAVNRLRRVQGCSENEISFENEAVDDYDFTTRDSCKVFHPDGGGLSYPLNVTKWLSAQDVGKSFYGEIFFNGEIEVKGVGSDCGDQKCTDLMVYLPYIDEVVCKAINKKLNLPISFVSEDVTNVTPVRRNKFTGEYTIAHAVAIIGDQQTELVGQESGCFKRSNQSGYLVYYHTLIAR